MVSAQHKLNLCPVRILKCYLVLRVLQPGPLFVFPDGIVVIRSFFMDQLANDFAGPVYQPIFIKAPVLG